MRSFYLCLFLICLAASPVSGVEIDFRETASAGSSMLTLQDVARISPPEKSEDLAGIRLFSPPAPGEQKCYKSSTLKAYVRQALDKGERVKWGGADKVCVRHEGALVTADKLRELINKELESALSHLDADRVSFETRSRPDPLSLPGGRAEYEVVFSDRDILDSRKATVIVRVEGRVVENLSIPGRVNAVVPVAVADGKLSRGDVISASDVTMEPENIAGLRRPCLDRQEAVGKRVKRTVSPGQPLSRSDLDRPVLVKRRHMVSMELKNGALYLQARGVAEENGKKGDVISVKNTSSGRNVSCTVTGEKQVQVEY